MTILLTTLPECYDTWCKDCSSDGSD